MNSRTAAKTIDWQNFEVQPEDLEFLSAHLLEIETPLGPNELAVQLIEHRLTRLAEEPSQEPSSQVYLPENSYPEGAHLTFPAFDNRTGRVLRTRPAVTMNGDAFSVIVVEFEDGSQKEFAAQLVNHALNNPQVESGEDSAAGDATLIRSVAQQIAPKIVEALRENPEFVYIAGRWFPKALIIDVDPGQLNVAEAQLDMANGRPLPTNELLGEVELPTGVNPKLAEFSLDLALQEDERFDEVGPSGEVAWFLRRLEPQAVRETPLFLQYETIEYDPGRLTEDMRDVERRLDDELAPIETQEDASPREIQIPLIFPHWRAGTLPLTKKISRLFPTALESPRVRFHFVDAENKERFQGWVVRRGKYVVGLRDWFLARGLMPGSHVKVAQGQNVGEIVVSAEAHRASKEWVRTALIGADGGVVFATLKQQVETSFDERLMIYLPGELAALDEAWRRRAGKRVALEPFVTNILRDLAKLSPQNHVHASELYAAVNLLTRCPPGPIFAMLASSPKFQHVGHLHFRVETASDG
ncbi:MAG: hypothetical protein ACRDFQ_02730 [Anaerolineales bacterium]